MPAEHARLSCSGAHRWMNCTPSVRLEAGFPDLGSEAAAEGTRAHALAEAKLRNSDELPSWDDGEMWECTEAYRDYVLGLLEAMKTEHPKLEIETRLDMSKWVPEGFGTADAVIIGMDTLHIIDFKYGKGVRVDAVNNAQMRLYALGAVDKYWDTYEFDKVKMHIFQPRIDNVATDEATVDELLEWGKTAAELAQKAYKGEGEPCTGSWCKFCKARHSCRAKMAEAFSVVKNQEPELMDSEEMAACLAKVDDAIKWMNGLKDYCLTQALEGDCLPGYKLVEGRSVRKITDPEGFAVKATEDGYKYDAIYKPRELQTLTTLEKLIGKKKVAAEYTDFITKPAGKPVLVPESDKRPALDSFEKAFEKLED